MTTKLASIVSYIFHPLFLPTYFLLILFNLNVYINFVLPFNLKLLVVGNVFLTTFILPLILMFLYKRKGIIASLQMETREERIFPFITIAIFYYLTYYFLSELNLPKVLSQFIVGAIILVVICLFVNLLWKISLHATGMGGITGALLGLTYVFPLDLLNLILLFIVFSGITGSSRLVLRIHTPSQIYCGFGLGFSIMAAVFIF